MWLTTKTTDRFCLVYEGDDAVNADGDEWIPADRADYVEGKKADKFFCRPLNADECFRIIQATQRDSSFIAFASHLGVVKIECDGRSIEDADQIKEILDNAQNMGPILKLSNAIFQVSREGLDALPFRDSGVTVER